MFFARGGVGASFDDGLGFKACQSWVSSTDSLSPPHRICLIVGTNIEKLIYILDLGGGGDCVDTRPILRIPPSFRNVQFCVVESILYILKIRPTWDSVADHDDVYRFKLSDNFSDVVLDDNMLEKVPILLSPKANAVPLQFDPIANWKLLDQDIKLRGRDRNFISVNGQLCVDSFGVSRLKGENSSVVEFPLPHFPSVSRSVILLDSCTPCVVRATIDPFYRDDCYEFLTTPCWCVDVFQVGLLNLLADRDGGEKKKEDVKHTVSFKLCINNQKTHSISLVGLFPF